MAYSFLRYVVTAQRDMREYFFLNPEMGMVRSGTKVFRMITSSETPDRPTLNSLIAALMSHYDSVYHACERIPSYSREQTIYDRFIYLVSRYAKQQHQLGFYADKMCLTERYLGSVVRQVSGLTAKQHLVPLQVFQTPHHTQSLSL